MGLSTMPCQKTSPLKTLKKNWVYKGLALCRVQGRALPLSIKKIYLLAILLKMKIEPYGTKYSAETAAWL